MYLYPNSQREFMFKSIQFSDWTCITCNRCSSGKWWNTSPGIEKCVSFYIHPDPLLCHLWLCLCIRHWSLCPKLPYIPLCGIRKGAAWIRMEKPSSETSVSVDHYCALSQQRFLPNAVCTDLPSSRTWCEQTCLLELSVKVLFFLSCANASISGWQNATWDDGFVCSLVFW